MNNYFRLNPYCHLIKGEKDGCIYDLAQGRMIVISNEIYKTLNLCEKNIPLDEIPDLDQEMLNQLEDIGIGLFYERPVFIDKLILGVPEPIENSLPSNHQVNTAFFEIENECNFDCVFCKKGDNALFRRTGCKRWSITGDKLTLDQWKNLVDQVKKLSCEKIVFTGGEPFINMKGLQEICKYARKQGIEKFVVYTNGYILNDEIISLIKSYDIELCIQINGVQDEVYKEISRISDAGKTVFEHVKKLKDEKIKYKLVFLINRLNEQDITNAIQKYAEFTEARNMSTEFIYPVPKNEFYSEKYIEVMNDKKKALTSVGLGLNSFCNARKRHNCYSYQIAITITGDVLPCIMSRDFLLGNIKEKDLASILRSKDVETYRGLNKDKVKKCKDCSLRYGCFDCRALEYAATKDLYGMEYCNK